MLKGLAGSPRDFLFCHYDPRWGKRHDAVRFSRTKNYKLYADGRIFKTGSDETEKQPLDVDSPVVRGARQKLQKILDSMPPIEKRPKISNRKNG